MSPNFDSINPADLYRRGVFIFVVDTVTTAIENPSERIRYWSDNIPVSVEQLDRVCEESKYMYLGNGWYVTQSRTHGRFRYIYLILIAREYLYQNRFLKDEPNPEFDFPKNIVIVPLGDIGIAVKDIDHNPLFVVNSKMPSTATSGISLLFRWMTVIAGCMMIVFVFNEPNLYRQNLRHLITAFVLLTGLRIIIFFNSDYFNGDMYLFSPALYADSEYLPSLGDLLLDLLFLFLFIIILFAAKDRLRTRFHSNRTGFISSCIVVALFLYGTLYVIKSLTFNSEISFRIYNMNDITIFTFLAYFVMTLVFAQLCLMVYLQGYVFDFADVNKQRIIQGLIALPTMYVLMKNISDTSLIFVIFLAIDFLLRNKSQSGLRLSSFVWLALVISLYTSFSLIANNATKEREQRAVLAKGLLAENDPVAEMLLKDMEKNIAADPYVKKMLYPELVGNDNLYEVLIDKYFRGYFHRYELIYHVCRPDVLLYIADEDKNENCIKFFEQEKNAGRPLSGSTHFYFMNNYWGRIRYLGDFMFVEKTDTAFLFLELYSKREIGSSIGYPELLRFESSGINYEARGYSYAKYSDRKRVSKVGTYDYLFELPTKHKEGFYERNGYSHFLFKTQDGNVAILSYPNLRYSEIVSIFSYSFVIFILVLFFLLATAGLKPNISLGKNSYRRKITLMMLAGIIGALTTLTVAMLAYTVGQSEKKNLETINSKMQSTIIELDQALFDAERIVPEMYGTLEATLVLLSNALNTDLNMYDIAGDLIVSSRNEIFDKRLIGTKMNREAYHSLADDKQSKFIHSEHLGSVSYYSSYMTYYNRRGEAIAYINILHFNNQSEFRTELISLTGAIMNIYIILIVIGISLAVFVSNQITRPLDLLRRKMAELNLTARPEPIDYRENNELGDLVRVYNRMIGELAESARIMAENERESAWREMARQIAHEIKNPLTPMKLNIQLAVRMKNENRPGWQSKMDEAIRSTLEQIDLLSYIASEFSNFARMGKAVLESVDVTQAIRSVLVLFAGYDHIKFVFNSDENEYFVTANREQLHRVLTNLLKNSIQAVERISVPQITVTTEKRDDICVIRILDNGVGIAEDVARNLFRPNFTTKSGGTGLGLAISKSIIESFGGTITFIPNCGGACFEIYLKKVKS
jgi:signal transduction histidine kinase